MFRVKWNVTYLDNKIILVHTYMVHIFFEQDCVGLKRAKTLF
jgi:hypothetical protein